MIFMKKNKLIVYHFKNGKKNEKEKSTKETRISEQFLNDSKHFNPNKHQAGITVFKHSPSLYRNPSPQKIEKIIYN